jgi:uncharacterized membrane protein
VARARALGAEPVDDDTLEQRVRAALGRVTAHASAIEVTARDGTVRLDGPVLQREWARVIRGVGRVRGVGSVEDRLMAHREAGRVPGLQGDRAPPASVWRRQWAPAPRFLAGTAGAALAAAGLSRRGPVRGALVAAGLGLVARSAINRPVRHDGRRDELDIVRDLEVAAPVEAVFAFWSAFENLPRFLAPVKEVRRLDSGRWRWVAEGPAGRFEWDVEVTERVPNQALAWRSVAGAPVDHSGTLHFESAGKRGTRMELRLRYDPPENDAARAFIRLLGPDPRATVEDDLVRLKAIVEGEAKSGSRLDDSE